jgi:hypothetical protein
MLSKLPEQRSKGATRPLRRAEQYGADRKCGERRRPLLAASRFVGPDWSGGGQ